MLGSELVNQMSLRLAEWLDDSHADLGVLVNWLQGYDLPGADRDDHTFLWIVRSIPVGARRHRTREKLAEKIALLLAEKPVENPLGTQPERILTNLFLLCANLRVRQILAGPLYAVFERLEGKKELPSYVTDLVLDSLRDALIENQLDSRLQPIWETLVKGRKHSLLPGNPEDGWRGFVGMPPSSEKLGQPPLRWVGEALAALASHFNGVPRRNELFVGAIDSFCTRYGGGNVIMRTLIEQADSNNWPAWAIRSLPDHFVIIEDRKDEVEVYASDQLYCIITTLNQDIESSSHGARMLEAILHPVGSVFGRGKTHVEKSLPAVVADSGRATPQSRKANVIQELCSGRIYKMRLPKQVARRVEQLAPQISGSIRSNPFLGERASWGVYGDFLETIRLESHFRGDHPLERAVTNALPEVRRITLHDPGQ